MTRAEREVGFSIYVGSDWDSLREELERAHPPSLWQRIGLFLERILRR